MSQLGKCPTCKGAVSTSADACPHCGERYFFEKTFYDGKKKIDFSICGGDVKKIIDLRTGRPWVHPTLD